MNHPAPPQTDSPWQPAWLRSAVVYHVYPLGFFGCPFVNPCVSGTDYRPDDRRTPALAGLRDHYDHLRDLGVDTVYFSPVFESEIHGYDTIDYFAVDRRLGDGELLGAIVDELHGLGIRVILDGVFNHVGIHHAAFRDLRTAGARSPYVSWFKDVVFDAPGPMGFGFSWRGWEGYANLPELNLESPDARAHVIDAAAHWVREIGIDGWRLDVAYCIEPDVWSEFRRAVKEANPDAVLIGEIDLGDYRRWVNPRALDSCTHYLLYRSMQRAFAEVDLNELAALLRRTADADLGRYRGLPLLTFLGNHDVARAASAIADPALLACAMVLLFTAPGVPALYYGDEFATRGKKTTGDRDRDLRRPMPADRSQWPEGGEALYDLVRRLVALRRRTPALQSGGFRLLASDRTALAFRRGDGADAAVVLLNCGAKARTLRIEGCADGNWIDRLDESTRHAASAGVLEWTLPARSGAVLTRS